MYFLKQSLFAYLYMVFMLIIAIAITYIGDITVEFILLVLNLALYTFIVFTAYYKEGGEAYKKLEANDMERRNIARTGDDIKLQIAPEYAWYKGIIIGLFLCIPLFVCLVIHTILAITTGGALNGAGAVAGVIYMEFFAPYLVFANGVAISAGAYYILCYVFGYFALVCGLSYYLGAMKYKRQLEKLDEIDKTIYGEDGKGSVK